LSIDGDHELWRISARVGALNNVDYGVFKNDIAQVVDEVLEEQRQQIARRAEKRATGGDSAPAPAKPIALNPEHDPPTQLVMAADGITPQGHSPTGNNQGITAVYTGLVPVVYKAQREMLNGLVWNFVTDLLTIAVVMTIVFLDLSAALIILIPSVFPMVVVFGIMGWSNIVVDVGTVMTPTVALGVSVDDVVHFLIWYRNGLRQGKTRVQSVMLAYEGCARAMYQSWSVLGLGLAVFALSAFIPTQRFGIMMVTLLTAALIGNLLLLPAVLLSPLGWFFGRRLMRKAKREGKTPATPIKVEELPAPPEPLSHVIPPQVRRDPSHRSVKT
jgi:predicted RND superfamily exporter protein